MLKNDQIYFKNLAVFTTQDFQGMFGHFSTLCMKGLTYYAPMISIYFHTFQYSAVIADKY